MKCSKFSSHQSDRDGSYFFSLAALVLSADSRHPANPLHDRFLKEAPAAWAELDAWIARHTRAVVRDDFFWIREDGDQTDRMRRIYTYKQARDNVMILLPPFVAGDKAAGAPGDVFPQDVTCINGRYSFRLSRECADTPWVVTQLAEDGHLRDWLARSGEPLRTGLLIDRVFLGDLLKDKCFAVHAVAPVSCDGRECVEVSWELDSTAGPLKSRVRRGKVVLDPSRRWVILKSDADLDDAAGALHATATFNYRDTPAGYPLIEREQTETFGYEQGVHHVVCSYQLSVDADIPDQEFTLSAFGLPEPGLPGHRHTSFPFLLIIGAAFLFMLGLALWRRASKQRSGATG